MMAELDPLETAPLAEQAREAILDAILNRRFVDRLPPEDELARMLDVSRTTVRAALQSLEQGGVVTRRRAVGTLIHTNVSASRLALQRLIGYDRLLEEMGGKVEIAVNWKLGKGAADFVTAFGLSPSERCLLTEKSYSVDGTVAIYIRDAIRASDVVSNPESDIPPSLFEFSRRHMSEPINHAIAEIVPMLKQKRTSTRLELKQGQPFIRLHQRAYTRSDDGRQVAFSITDVDDSLVRFEIFRK